MNTQEKEFLRQALDAKHYAICFHCFCEIDLRQHRHMVEALGNLIHIKCPPITPKYT